MNRQIKFWGFQLALLITLLLVVEIGLRFAGYKPGDMKPKWLNFHPVDSLYLVPDFRTNEDGILVANPHFFEEQMHLYINDDGFRTKSFADIDTTKKKVLFLGDSFTWGMTAEPLDSCFADILRRETDYEIINTGIPAADPPQYAEIGKKYIPLLKPDLVLVMFFTGNDLMRQDRKIIPGEPFYYYTNAGAILADMDGKHFKTAQEAYNYFVDDKYYLHHPKNTFEWVVSKSSLLSRLYSIRYRIDEKLEYERMIKHTDVTKKYLRNILRTCEASHCGVRFVLIPEIKEADKNLDDYKEKYADLLNDYSIKDYWLIFPNKKSNFNDYPDAHLNNRGHRYYANVLRNVINQYFSKK